MSESVTKRKPRRAKPATVKVATEPGGEAEPPPQLPEPEPGLSPEEAEAERREYLLTRFWLSARGFWGKNGYRLAWPLSLGLVVLIVATVGFQYGINVWNRAIFDAIEKHDARAVFHLTGIFSRLRSAALPLGWRRCSCGCRSSAAGAPGSPMQC